MNKESIASLVETLEILISSVENLKNSVDANDKKG